MESTSENIPAGSGSWIKAAWFEIREFILSWKYLALLAFWLFTGSFVYFMLASSTNAIRDLLGAFTNDQSDAVVFQLFFFDTGLVKAMLFSLIAITAARLPNERSTGKLYIYLSKPITRNQLLLSRFVASFVIMSSLLWITVLTFWGGFASVVTGFSPQFYVSLTIAFEGGIAFLIAFVLLVSVLVKKPATAMILVFVIAAMFISIDALRFTDPQINDIARFSPLYYVTYFLEYEFSAIKVIDVVRSIGVLAGATIVPYLAAMWVLNTRDL